MKKKSASRRKKLPLLLGALLILSVAAYGTRAYFSDSTKQQANIELKLGDVEISTSETSWEYTTNGTDLESSNKTKDDQTYISYTNVKPGDSFERTYTITNTGSLDVEVGLNYSGKNIDPKQPLDLNTIPLELINKSHLIADTPFLITISGFENNLFLKANDKEKNKVDYKVIITVDENAAEDFNINSKAIAKAKADGKTLNTIVSDFLQEALTINAKQVE